MKHQLIARKSNFDEDNHEKIAKFAATIGILVTAIFLISYRTQPGPSVAEFAKRGPHYWMDALHYLNIYPLHGRVKSVNNPLGTHVFDENGRLSQFINKSSNGHRFGKIYEATSNGVHVYDVKNWQSATQYEKTNLDERCNLRQKDNATITYRCTLTTPRHYTNRTIHYEQATGLLSISADNRIHEVWRFDEVGRFLSTEVHHARYLTQETVKLDGETVKISEIQHERIQYHSEDFSTYSTQGRIIYEGSWLARQQVYVEKWWDNSLKKPLNNTQNSSNHILDRDHQQNPSVVLNIGAEFNATYSFTYEYW